MAYTPFDNSLFSNPGRQRVAQGLMGNPSIFASPQPSWNGSHSGSTAPVGASLPKPIGQMAPALDPVIAPPPVQPIGQPVAAPIAAPSVAPSPPSATLPKPIGQMAPPIAAPQPVSAQPTPLGWQMAPPVSPGVAKVATALQSSRLGGGM